MDEIANFLRTNAPDMPSEDIQKYSQHWGENQFKWEEMVNQTIEKHLSLSGICCFAGSADNILMWSHYGDSHKGICIKFDVLADPDFFSVPLNVKYETNYPMYNHVKDSSKLVEHLIIPKAECWKYEQELRILKVKFGAVKIKKEAIVEVIFGCNCNLDEINKTKKLIKNSGFDDVTLKKAIKSKSSYKLTIETL